MLFGHLSLRSGRKSTIITTNISFERWNEIFGDAVLTAAMQLTTNSKNLFIFIE
jgi:DNA replication protein DnaC